MSSVETCRNGPALTVTINRPDRANALDLETIDALFDVFADPGDARVQRLYLTDEGERAWRTSERVSFKNTPHSVRASQ